MSNSDLSLTETPTALTTCSLKFVPFKGEWLVLGLVIFAGIKVITHRRIFQVKRKKTDGHIGYSCFIVVTLKKKNK